MASACVNTVGVSPENFPPAPKCSSYGWLSPRVSFTREEESSKSKLGSDSSSGSDPVLSDPGDFEFRLGEDPVAMLPADELFFDGKLMPLQLSSSVTSTTNSSSYNFSLPEIRSPETAKCITGVDPYLFSPKAPRCSSRWRELLGLKKLNQNQTQSTKAQSQKTASFLTSNTNTNSNSSAAKSLKLLLDRVSKTTSNVPSSASLDASLSLPLLKDTDSESVSISSSRLSLSSSSSSHDHDHDHDHDLPRLSLDSEKPNPGPSPNPFLRNQNPNPPRMRLVKARTDNVTSGNNTNSGCNTGRSVRSPMRRQVNTGESGRGVSADSPRMNSSGKVVFQSLERSSSSPSAFNGGPRLKHRGMERSYSANVRVTPVLNVPVCTLRGSSKSGSVFGFGQLFSSSPQKKEGNGGGGSNTIKVQRNSRNRISDRS